MKASRGGTRTLRIIGGRWRSRLLSFVDAPGLRPTPDRVRETLFNWLQSEVPNRHVLDMYAGSGALAFEALSRGAASATLIETDAQQVRALQATAQSLGADQARVIRDDSLRWLASASLPEGGYGLIVLDPPFHQGHIDKTLAALHTKGWLLANTWVYVETELAPEELTVPSCLGLHRHTRAGMVWALLFRVETEADAAN
ncbi:MAG: 16S rRNA (guanine(966)-N(2))-methyltransferase RsmD [Paraperlucidibaca sp.]